MLKGCDYAGRIMKKENNKANGEKDELKTVK